MADTIACPLKDNLMSIANETIPSLPSTLFNIVPFQCSSDDMLRIFRREFIHNNLGHGERIYPYIYLNHAYEVTHNQAIKPLLDYFKPTKESLMKALWHFNNAKNADYLPTNALEWHGFSSLDEVSTVIENAFNGQNVNGLDRIENLRGYINDANTICGLILDAFTEEDYQYDYESVAPHSYSRNSVYKPLLFYIDFILRENALKRFKMMFYSLKYRDCFRRLLWVKVREPKIRSKYHPDNLAKMLEDRGDLDVDELDALMDKW